MIPYWTSPDGRHVIYCGDCLDVLPTLAAGSADAVVTDPPYGLSFMGKDWDHGVPGVHFWREVFRVLKPGAHLLAFGGTRTHHRLVCAIEDAGFEIRDEMQWLYGSGFPKSLDVSKQLDKAAGAEREVVGIGRGTGKQNPAWNGTAAGRTENSLKPEYDLTAPATAAARQWSGWGTALKPACEPICVARKPLEGTVAANVLKHGTGALNIDGSRVALNDYDKTEYIPNRVGYKDPEGYVNPAGKGVSTNFVSPEHKTMAMMVKGRWPANVLHDGSAEVLAAFAMFGESKGGSSPIQRKEGFQRFNGQDYAGGKTYNTPAYESPGYNDTGTAARFFKCCPWSEAELRFFYTAKASKTDRGNYTNGALPLFDVPEEVFTNSHCTVKPSALIEYLVRLVTPPGGIVLDPFMGSGTTGVACAQLGRKFIGIDISRDYCDIAVKRMERELSQPHLPGMEPEKAVQGTMFNK